MRTRPSSPISHWPGLWTAALGLCFAAVGGSTLPGFWHSPFRIVGTNESKTKQEQSGPAASRSKMSSLPGLQPLPFPLLHPCPQSGHFGLRGSPKSCVFPAPAWVTGSGGARRLPGGQHWLTGKDCGAGASQGLLSAFSGPVPVSPQPHCEGT